MNMENNQNINSQPPKRDNRVVILLSVILVVLFAIIVAIVAMNISMKNKELRDSADRVMGYGLPTQSTTENHANSEENGVVNSTVQSSEQNTPTSAQSGTTGVSATTLASGSPGNSASPAKKPSTVNDVLTCYNNAVNKAINSKAGYTKSRTTNINSLDGGALLKIQLVVDMINDFLGEGTTEYKNEKGKAEYLSKASLTQSDLSLFNVAENNGIYTITLGLKNGQSQANASGSSDTSALARSGLFVGKGDKKAYDYKNSENIYTAVNGFDDATAESARAQVVNAKIVAKIDSKTGKMIEMTVMWDWNFQLTNVKYTVVNVKEAKGTATSTVKVSDFQW